MSLYPSLEDMKVDQMCKEQIKQMGRQSESSAPPLSTSTPMPSNGATLYPDLGFYMDLELSEVIKGENMPEYSQIALLQQRELIIPAGANSALIAPVSGQSVGLQRAQVTHVKAIDKGIFVCVVVDKSPAALVGLRFGDQILQINDKNVAGYSMDKVHDMFKKSPVNGIKVAVRDRPFERTITLHKDSTGSIGFQFKNGKIVTLVKDSSAARNGVLINHQLLEVDGQNVVGLKDKQIRSIIDKAAQIMALAMGIVIVIDVIHYNTLITQLATRAVTGAK
ncbi:hypothetical protein NQ314_002644 [Rhamnusium bicolor]|uniref:PDZ domain-containing protein n=1 Tax=Rhamnusium bicolor TaxID=1586634 RepID=A0AAV8ZRT0_9CUCU|nr:hypothetical protein NQ314_002644 [Rhamnusium bicolor]